MRSKALIFGIIFVAALALRAGGQTGLEERLFQEAKLFIFDEEWTKALGKLDELLNRYPAGPLVPQALFYRGKCLKKQDGREREALTAFEAYLQQKGKSGSLVEEAETSIIDLALDLTARGDKAPIKKVEERLESPNKVVRYYAAFRLSYVKDRQAAAKSIPILKKIIAEEKDAELRDRARIYLLRVSPEALREVEERRAEPRARILKIRVEVIGKREPEVSINIPWALADLALRSIPEKDKAAIRAKGYDLDRLIDELVKTKESLVEIRDEGRVIKIWIE